MKKFGLFPVPLLLWPNICKNDKFADSTTKLNYETLVKERSCSRSVSSMFKSGNQLISQREKLKSSFRVAINLTCMLLGGGGKPEYPERPHAHANSTQKGPSRDLIQELSWKCMLIGLAQIITRHAPSVPPEIHTTCTHPLTCTMSSFTSVLDLNTASH